MGGGVVIVIFVCALVSTGFADFNCYPNIPNLVEFYGNKLTCPDNQVCNSKGKFVNRETKLRACLDAKEICAYTCNANVSQVTVNLVTFACGDGKQCNVDKTSCDVCVNKPCDKSVYKCSDDGTKAIFNGGFELTCPKASCNKNYEYPCQPCLVSTPARRGIRGNRNRSYFL